MSHQHTHAEATHETAARAPVAAPEADAVHEARPEPRAPESDLAANSEAALVPQETPIVKPPVQSVLPLAANDVKALEPVNEELRAKAEQKLADYIGTADAQNKPRIHASLTEGLVLTLKENINHQHDGLELCFQGPALTTGSGLFAEQIIAALKEHPVFAPLFNDEKTRPHFMKPTEAGKEDMLHVHVNNLTAEQFITLVNNIANDVPAPKPQHEQVMERATGTAIATQKKEHANENPLPMVQGPVAALDKGLAHENDNELAAQGIAR